VELPKNLEDFRRWHERLIGQLERRVFRWPQAATAAEVVRESKDGAILLATEPALAVTAFRAAKPEKPERFWLLVLNADEAEDKLPAWAKELVGERDAILLLSPRGCGSLAWTLKSPPNYVERSHALLGTTVDTGRVWDVRATARWVHENDEHSARVHVAGKGPAGILAAYAALFEPSIEAVTVIEPPTSHRDGPIFLNVLRVLDVPDALGMLAPLPLTVVHARDQAFERTRQIYAAAGAQGKLRMK
jgi:hypothetical protein